MKDEKRKEMVLNYDDVDIINVSKYENGNFFIDFDSSLSDIPSSREEMIKIGKHILKCAEYEEQEINKRTSKEYKCPVAVMTGPAGSGKTHFMEKIYKLLSDDGDNVLRVCETYMYKDIDSKLKKESESFDLIIIDDLPASEDFR